jgi:hypothetical protein
MGAAVAAVAAIVSFVIIAILQPILRGYALAQPKDDQVCLSLWH